MKDDFFVRINLLSDNLGNSWPGNNSNLILLPNSPQAAGDMLNNMVTSFSAANIIGEEMKKSNQKNPRMGNKDQ